MHGLICMEGGLVGGVGVNGRGHRERGYTLDALLECWNSCQKWQALASGEVQSLAGHYCLCLLLPPPGAYIQFFLSLGPGHGGGERANHRASAMK